MTTGSDTYMGMAVPLYGDFEIVGRTAATDIVTITQPGGASGNALNIRTSAGTAIFTINSSGDIATDLNLAASIDLEIAGTAAGTGGKLRFSAFATTAPTTGLTLGDFFLAKASNTVQLGVCTDTTQNTLVYLTQNTSTFGRSSPS